jgi:hypothetical protein
MLMVWLLWILVVGGGFYMGGMSALALERQGFDLAVAGNAVVYLGTALYGLPRLLKLLRGLF